MRMDKFTFGVVVRELKQPYVLSFTTVRSIESVWVQVQDEKGRTGVGEAVALPGYGHETTESIKKIIAGLQGKIEGQDAVDIKKELEPDFGDHPFAISAVFTALDFLDWQEGSKININPVPLVWALNTEPDKSAIDESIDNGINAGFTHFKVKIGRNVTADIDKARYIINRCNEENYYVRFDANQGYSLDEALQFCHGLEDIQSSHLFWIEQPLDTNDWNGTEKLCGQTFLPICLDEAIYNAEDIRRASDIGCRAVKLKLCKSPGMAGCLDLARFANKCKLKVTLGNGVASDISGLCEAMVIDKDRRLFTDVNECNGFTKIKDYVMFKSLGLEKDRLALGRFELKDLSLLPSGSF